MKSRRKIKLRNFCYIVKIKSYWGIALLIKRDLSYCVHYDYATVLTAML